VSKAFLSQDAAARSAGLAAPAPVPEGGVYVLAGGSYIIGVGGSYVIGAPVLVGGVVDGGTTVVAGGGTVVVVLASVDILSAGI